MPRLSSSQNARNDKLTVYEQCKKMIEAKYSCKELKNEEIKPEIKSNDGNSAITPKKEIKRIPVSRKRKDRFLKENATVLKMLYAQFIEAQNIANDLKKQAQTQSELLEKPKPTLPDLNHHCINTVNPYLNTQSIMAQNDVQQTKHEEITKSRPCRESVNTKSYQEPVVQVVKVPKTKSPAFVCSICDSSFKKKRELTLHKNSFHKKKTKLNNKQVFCNVCDKEFKRTKTFVDRCRTHSAPPYACKVCKRGYFSKKRLKLHHCKAGKEEKPSVWDACKKVLAEKSHQLEPNVTSQVSTPKLPIIKNVFQGVDESAFLKFQEESVSCKNVSDGECADVECRDFQSHHLVHCSDKSLDSVDTDSTSLCCNICNGTCTDTENFQLHCLTHSNEEFCHLNESEESLHVCNICGKCFTEAENFQSHLLFHGEKKINIVKETKSNLCGSSFINLENLQSPGLSHANEELFNVVEEEKPIVCNICGKCCTGIESFQSHCLTHDTQFSNSITEWCMENGLIAANAECSACKNVMCLVIKDSSDGYIWECQKKGTNMHNIKRSVRKNSCFEESKLSMREILMLMNIWVQKSNHVFLSFKLSFTVMD
ncbi:uncharacterized protein TNCT_434961 [Trichonephila clavata]|uniref:C2H2-type domain-containing protein n=1 Tax=Trichonephila clavata TaxID=2740835 RepID=A0A8X6G2F6_TRICU|nr:uncharacterized protein TNCT_434961 [Trichonephila clavata]